MIFYPSEQLRRADNELEYQKVKAAADLRDKGAYSDEAILRALRPVIEMLSKELKPQ